MNSNSDTQSEAPPSANSVIRALAGISVAVRVVMSLSIVLFGVSASAGDDRVPGIPSFHLEYPSAGLHQFILGSTCLSLQASRLELDCNPAFLASSSRTQFRISATVNDHIKQVNFYRERLQADDGVGIVDSVLSNHAPLVARATSALWYQRDFWAIGYVPFRGGFGSLVRNSAYPEVFAHIYKESELFAKAGFVAENDQNLQAGLQVRYVERDLFRKKFDLLDALGDPKQLKIEKEKSLYLEPGISYSFDSFTAKSSAWASSVSATLTQLRITQSGYKSAFEPILDVGFATAPPFAGGNLRTTTHYTNQPDLDLFSRFRWGAIYDFADRAAVSLGLGKSMAGLGVNGNIDSVVLGAGVKTEEISPDQWQSQRITTVLFEAGLVF